MSRATRDSEDTRLERTYFPALLSRRASSASRAARVFRSLVCLSKGDFEDAINAIAYAD